MYPILFQIGHQNVSSFFFLVMVSSLVSTLYIAHLAKRFGEDPVVMLDLGILTTITCILGARIFHILVEYPWYYWEKPVRVFYFWQGGFVSIGAILLSTVAWIVYFRWRKLDLFRHVDLAIMAVPIITFFVRVGCLLAGCCYGKPTNFFFHLTFTDPRSAAGHVVPGIPLHATQIYFMIDAALLFFFLRWLYPRRRFTGQIPAVFFIWSGTTRFFIEFLRGDFDRGLYFEGLLSTGQLAMIASVLVGIVMWVRLRKRRIVS